MVQDVKGKNTLIGKIFGVYTFEFEKGIKRSVILMENINNTGKNAFNMYDLKGSTYHR